jgi:hypothetical protein
MKRFSIYAFIAFTLTMIIPMPGRFVYGVVLALEFNILLFVGILINSLIKKMKLDELNSFIYIFLFIAITVLFRQILKITQPEIALTLGILSFFPSVSIFLLGYIFTNSEKKLSEKIKIDMKDSLFYTLYLLIFNLFRDVVGYGTFTFFGSNHQIYQKVLFDSSKLSFTSIVASLPGALAATAIIMYVYFFLKNKFQIIKNAE